MKKSFSIIISIGLILLTGVIILILFLTVPQNEPENGKNEQVYFTSNPNSSQESARSGTDGEDINAMTSKSDIYTIKAYQGHIGVFLNDEAQPVREVHVLLSSLPPEDQALLENGITANSQGEVQIILEDYTS